MNFFQQHQEQEQQLRRREHYSCMREADEGVTFLKNEKGLQQKPRRTSIIPRLCLRLDREQLELESPVKTYSDVSDEESIKRPSSLTNHRRILKLLGTNVIPSPTKKKRGTFFRESPSKRTSQTKLNRRFKSRLDWCLRRLWKEAPYSGKESEEQVTSNPKAKDDDRSTQCTSPSDFLSTSSTSAFTPVASSQNTLSVFPTQRCLNLNKLSLYPQLARHQRIPSESTLSINETNSFLSVSFSEDGAQLVVPAEDDNRTTLGVSFPHPAIFEKTGQAENPRPQPNQFTPESQVWRLVDSDPMGDEVTEPPSPVLVDTIKADETWSIPDSPSRLICTPPPTDGSISSPENLELSAIWDNRFCNPMRSLMEEGGLCGSMEDISVASSVPFDERAIDTARKRLPFDEIVSDRERIGLDPRMMMLSKLSESSSIGNAYLDDDSSSDDEWLHCSGII